MQVDDKSETTTRLSQSHHLKTAWNGVLTLLWGMWWGGLTFYAIVVVPIGTEQLGSTGQGFVTQQVTQWHNLLSVGMLLATFVEAYRRQSWYLWTHVAALVLITTGLIGWHYRLTQMMDFSHESVPSDFYSQHAIYLWLTAAQWGVGLLMPIWLLDRSK